MFALSMVLLAANGNILYASVNGFDSKMDCQVVASFVKDRPYFDYDNGVYKLQATDCLREYGA